MKKLLTSAILLFALAFPLLALASNPTVTISTIYNNSVRMKAYSFSFTTNIAVSVVDTAFILPASSTPFDIGGGQGAHPADSLITLELSSNYTTTADSVRYTVLFLGTSAVSPEYEAGDLKTWSVLYSDATTFSNAAASINGRFVTIKVPIRRLAGQINKMRIAICEQSDKNATQTVTGRLLIPIR